MQKYESLRKVALLPVLLADITGMGHGIQRAGFHSREFGVFMQ